jgi:hypothetical protein
MPHLPPQARGIGQRRFAPVDLISLGQWEPSEKFNHGKFHIIVPEGQLRVSRGFKSLSHGSQGFKIKPKP